MKIRISLALVAVLGQGALLGAAIPETLKPDQAPNYHRVSPQLATAGQPSAETLKEAKALGFTTFVDLRTPREGIEKDREILERLGVRFVSVPITPGSFSLADAKAVAAVLDDPKAGPVFLYCHSSNRVGGVWAVVQALRGKSDEEALADGRKVGLKSPSMVEATKRVLKEVR
jgi:uncharacterized protein (TIGR01244 family)